MEATPLKVSSITDSACSLSSNPKQFCTLLTFNVSPNFASQIEKPGKRIYLMELTTLLVISSTLFVQKVYDKKLFA